MKLIDRKTVLFLAFAAIAGLLTPAPAWAMDYHWIGAGTGGKTATDPADPTTQWNVPTNWEEGQPPGPADTVYLPLANAGYVSAPSGSIGGIIIDGPSSDGAFHISQGADLTASSGVTVGYSAQGRVVQTGGSFTAGLSLNVGSGTHLAVGTYLLEGGSLTVAGPHREVIGALGTGVFTQTGGAHVVEGELCVGSGFDYASGTLNIGGGLLRVGELTVASGYSRGALNITSDQARIEANVSLAAKSIVTAVPGSAIHVYYSFRNYSKDESALADLGNLALMYDVAPQPSSVQIEAAGKDLGPVLDGFTGNFTLGTLALGGAQPVTGVMFDLVDNGNGPGECLYVHNITIGAGSELDLNGLHVYYDGSLRNNGSIVGGTPIFVPEPSVLVLTAAGLAALGVRRLRKRALWA